MRVILVDPVRDPRWDAFVTSHPQGTIYHHSAWFKVLSDSYGYAPQYYAVEDNMEFRAIAPFLHVRSRLTKNRLVCLPFSDYCFPLAMGPGEMKLLMDTILPKASDLHIPIEIRSWGNVSQPSEFGLLEKPHFVIHRTDLDNGRKEQLSKIDTRARRGIRTAEKRGVTVKLTTEVSDMKQFYWLNVQTRKKLGVLPQPLRFFESIQRHIVSRGHGFLLMAEAGGVTIAGVLYLIFRDTLTYKFNASKTAQLSLHPNHLLIWKGMEIAIKRGCKHFDFGRSDPDSSSLREFKSQWAAKEFALPYYYFPRTTGIGPATEDSMKRKAMALFTRAVPISVLRLASSVLYRHIP